MANTRIGRTVSVAGSRRKATFSAWIKRTGLGEAWLLSAGGTYSSGSTFKLGFNSANGCFIIETGGTPRIESNNVFRDTSGYYHYVVGIDTTQATAENRLKFYINGVQVTSFMTETYPTLNQDFSMNNTGSDNNMWLGGRGEALYEFNGIMSHVHWIDGTQYAASDFGETDTTTGEWKIKTSPSVTYGENGFFVLKDGSSLTDQSGEGNNLTLLTGTLTKTEDNPSNVFATMNPLTNYFASATFSNGNTTVDFNNTNEKYVIGTLGMNSGKYYWEGKLVSHSGNSYAQMGIESVIKDYHSGYEADSYTYRGEGGGKKVNNGTFTAWGNSYTAGDIIGCAVDLDNNKIYFSKNGTWQESGDPTSGSTGTGAAFTLGTPSSGFYFPSIGKQDADTCKWSFNFGNGYFGSTQISSAGTNASGIGIFEYDVPANYTALSTKGFNE